ncbi:unannotated protein [freshwater metagenome]|uniref:Unannotated protein n=1 Tax=freshwater metagenome TaxID=449393 RepID=A0A6J5ZJD9_9ZZZZ
MAGNAVGRDREAADALLSNANPVEPLVAKFEESAGALVERVVAANQLGVVLAEPGDAVGSAGLLVNDANDQEVAVGRTPTAVRQLNPCCHLGRRLRLHVERATAPKFSIDHIAAPGVMRPLVRIGEHRVAVREQAERWAVGGSTQPRDEIRPLLSSADERYLEASRLEVGRKLLLQRALVAGRINRVVRDQAAQQARRVIGQLVHSPILNERRVNAVRTSR